MFSSNGTISQFTTVSNPHGFTGKAFLESLPERSQLKLPGAKSVVTPKQVHGIDFCELEGFATPEVVPECDALLCPYNPEEPRGIAIAIYTADCVPILIIGKSYAAVLHAGWRGMASGIIQNVLGKIREREPESLLNVLIGPCAQAGAYETGQEVVKALEPYVCYREGSESGKYLTDLSSTASKIINLYGPVALHNSGVCTITNSNWHSYRRDGARSGRNLSYLIV